MAKLFGGNFSQFKKNENGKGRIKTIFGKIRRYKEGKTCKFLAQILLAASPINDYDHFMESWILAAPESKFSPPNFLFLKFFIFRFI